MSAKGSMSEKRNEIAAAMYHVQNQHHIGFRDPVDDDLVACRKAA